jgi:hypothetical protein
MRNLTRFLALAALVGATTSCGDVVRNGRSPVYLIIDSLQAAKGDSPQTFGNPLNSDVITNVTTGGLCSLAKPCPTYFNDIGQVEMRTAPKDVTTSSSVAGPTTNNDVTITRYHVAYRRTDGRSTPGIDVPYSFDSSVTFTIPAGGSQKAAFEIVRHDAKLESPLVQLVNNPGVLNVMADVTFYGLDRVGNAISASGSIQIDFANFGDK